MPGSNIVAYEWPLKGTAHIAYETGDNHIHEMALRQKGTWRDSDITRLAGGPELEDALLAGSVWSTGHTQQIAYLSPMNADGHIYELVMYQDHPWSLEDIMRQPTGAAPADGFTLVAFGWKAAGTKQLVYTGRDGHLHELSAGVTGLWNYADLTQATGAPLVANALLAAYAWESGKTQQVVYVSEDGHLQELMSGLDGNWSHTDLTSVTGAPLAGTTSLAASAWEFAGTRQVVYTGDDGTLYELVCEQQGTWSFVDITSLTGAPLASGSALATYAWETGNTKQIVYVGSNHHIVELQMPLHSAWEFTDLTQLLHVPEASEDVIAAHEWTPEFAKHVVYLDTLENPRIHSLLFKHGEQWQHTDVTKATGSQSIV
jgi:hypothetical protein